MFNLVPAQGEPARFGFEVIGKIPIVIDASVRSGRDYGVVASVNDATETAGLLSSQVTFWGVPGDPRHNHVAGVGMRRRRLLRERRSASRVPRPAKCRGSRS